MKVFVFDLLAYGEQLDHPNLMAAAAAQRTKKLKLPIGGWHSKYHPKNLRHSNRMCHEFPRRGNKLAGEDARRVKHLLR